MNATELRLTSRETADLFNISLRQLQWWDERGLVSPRQLGHRRVYGESELASIELIAKLRAKNISLKSARRALKRPARKRTSWLLVNANGSRFEYPDSAEAVCRIMKRSRHPMVLIELNKEIA